MNCYLPMIRFSASEWVRVVYTYLEKVGFLAAASVTSAPIRNIVQQKAMLLVVLQAKM